MGFNVSYLAAASAGFLSFFTPCVLPLLPVYFGYLAGDAITNIEDKKVHRRLMINALGFVIGVSFVNVLLGFGAQSISKLLAQYEHILRYVGGGLIILFGLYFILDIHLMFFEKERKLEMKSYAPNFLKSLLLGAVFNFGWTPCNGPILGSILMIASFEKNYLASGSLMLVYSAGFGVMFLLSALLIGLFVGKVNKIYKYFGLIKKVSGGIMIVMGLLLIFNKLTWLQ